MEILFIGKAAYFPEEKILAIADLHIGYEQALIESGILIPKTQLHELKSNFQEILTKLKTQNHTPEKLILLGDIKHEFGRINYQEKKEILEFISFAQKNIKEIIAIRGNHDTMLEPILREQKIPLLNAYTTNKTCFMHGNLLHEECKSPEIKQIILGHLHPVVSIRHQAKQEKYKCFLRGKWHDKEILIIPSFSTLTEGMDILSGENNLAIRPNLLSFEAIIPLSTEEALSFPKLSQLLEKKLNRD